MNKLEFSSCLDPGEALLWTGRPMRKYWPSADEAATLIGGIIWILFVIAFAWNAFPLSHQALLFHGALLAAGVILAIAIPWL